jgi:hexulose-6-phosphate isomerase
MSTHDRRDFLKTSTAAALSLGLAPLFAAAPAADRPLIRKSLKYGMIKEELSILDKFRLLKELGYDGVELDSPNELPEREVLEARDKTGLEIPGVVNSLHWKAPLSDPDPAVRARCVESMKTALRDCKRYGGTTVLLVPAVVNDKVAYDDAYRRSQEEIRKLLPLAEETGIRIAIENVWNNFLLSPLEAARYIDEFDSPWIGWYFDVGNIVRYGWPEQWIRVLGPRILKIDVKEYSRKKQSDEGIWKGFEVEIGDGDCNWPAVNAALREVGYSGWGSAEVPGGDRERLRTIVERMERVYAA